MSSNKTYLAAAISECVAVWSLENGNTSLKAEFSTKKDPTSKHNHINCLQFNHNNKVLVSCNDAGEIVLNLSENGNAIGRLQASENVHAISLSRDSRLLCSGGDNKIVNLWNLEQKSIVQQFSGHTSPISCISFNHSDEHIASGSMSGDILVHDRTKNVQPVKLRAPNTHGINSIQYSRIKRNYIGTASDDGSIYVWDVITEKSVCALPLQHSAPATSIRFSPTNNLLFGSTGMDKKLHFYDVAEQRRVIQIDAGRPLTCLAFMDDGCNIAVGSHGRILFYDLRNTHQPKMNVDVANREIHYLAFSSAKKSASVTQTPKASKTTEMLPKKTPDSVQLKQQIANKENTFSLSNVTPQSTTKSPPISNATPFSNAAMLDIFSPARDPMSRTTPMPNYSAITPSSNLAKVQLSSSLDTKKKSDITKPTPNVSTTENAVFSPVQNDAALEKNISSMMPRLSMPETNAKKLSDFHISHEPSSLSFLKPSSFGNEATDLNRELNDIVTNLNYDAQPLHKQSNTFAELDIKKKISNVDQPKITQRNIFSDAPSLPSFSQPPSPIRPSIDVSKYQQQHSDPIDSMALESEALAPAPIYEQPMMMQQQQAMNMQQQQQVATMPFQAEWLKNIIEESMSNMKQYVHRDITNLHLDLIRQFHQQQEESAAMIKNLAAQIKPLLEEVQYLRDENRLLRDQQYKL